MKSSTKSGNKFHLIMCVCFKVMATDYDGGEWGKITFTLENEAPSSLSKLDGKEESEILSIKNLKESHLNEYNDRYIPRISRFHSESRSLFPTIKNRFKRLSKNVWSSSLKSYQRFTFNIEKRKNYSIPSHFNRYVRKRNEINSTADVLNLMGIDNFLNGSKNSLNKQRRSEKTSINENKAPIPKTISENLSLRNPLKWFHPLQNWKENFWIEPSSGHVYVIRVS